MKTKPSEITYEVTVYYDYFEGPLVETTDFVEQAKARKYINYLKRTLEKGLATYTLEKVEKTVVELN